MSSQPVPIPLASWPALTPFWQLSPSISARQQNVDNGNIINNGNNLRRISKRNYTDDGLVDVGYGLYRGAGGPGAYQHPTYMSPHSSWPLTAIGDGGNHPTAVTNAIPRLIPMSSCSNGNSNILQFHPSPPRHYSNHHSLSNYNTNISSSNNNININNSINNNNSIIASCVQWAIGDHLEKVPEVAELHVDFDAEIEVPRRSALSQRRKSSSASSKSSILGDHHSSSFKEQLYKTELCRNMTELGSCEFGDDCYFAHSEAEKRQADAHKLHPNHRTVHCIEWNRGNVCRFGHRCAFIHRPPKSHFPVSAAAAAAAAAAAVNATATEGGELPPLSEALWNALLSEATPFEPRQFGSSKLTQKIIEGSTF